VRTIKALSWNVNGLRAVQKKGFLDWLAGASPDILCLQETKAHPGQLPPELTQVPGYTAHFASATKKGYSGVALYTKHPPLDVRYGFGAPEFDGEGRVIVADYGHFILLNI
jgi:exodeoxyribonuclease-3